MRRTTLILLLGAVSVALLLAGGQWWSRRDPLRGIHSRAAMAAALQQALPLGTPIGQAQASMERRGFSCGARANADWVQAREPGAGGLASEVTHRNIDFVLCEREGTGWTWAYLIHRVRMPFPVAEFWRVGLVHSGGTLTEILVSLSRRK